MNNERKIYGGRRTVPQETMGKYEKSYVHVIEVLEEKEQENEEEKVFEEIIAENFLSSVKSITLQISSVNPSRINSNKITPAHIISNC